MAPDVPATPIIIALAGLAAFGGLGCAGDDSGTRAGGGETRGAAAPAGAIFDVHIDELPTLNLVEDLRLGSVDQPDEMFSRIGGVGVAPDGRIAVLEQQDRHIRVYDAQGSLVRVIGREGSGPGEFLSPAGFGLSNDTIWALDYRNARLTVFDLEGNLLATVPGRGVRVDVPGFNARVEPARPIGGGLYASTFFAAGELGTNDSVRVPGFVFDSTGAVVDTAGTHFLPASTTRQIVVQNYGIIMAAASGDRPLSSGLGSDTVELRRPVASSASPSAFTITRRTETGDTAYHSRIRYEPIPLDRDSLVAMTVRQHEDTPVDPDVLARAVRDSLFPPPPFHPPVSRWRVAADQSVWLMLEDVGGDSARWLILRPNGSPSGVVTVPRDRSIMWVSENAAWFVDRDDRDVPFLVRRRVEG